ncbi:MAG: hypothetical protein GXO58_03935 [Thermodesulfobacteria bacterium]|nr:hypothetical protein [Thermodesulfobacteriota bacterium]
MYLLKTNWYVLVLSLLSLALASPCLGAISGAIEQKDDRIAIVRVKITPPAPTTVIITLDLPEGVKIEEAKPKYSRLLDKERKAQWLLTGIKPGKLDILIRFNREVDVKELKAIFRYKDVSSGKIVEATN